MKNKKIPIRGISRMLPSSTSEDGLSRDMINMRMYNGAWRPIGNPVQYASGAMEGASSYIHIITNGSDYLITYDATAGTVLYKPLTSGSNSTLTTIGAGKVIRFTSLHNVLIVINETDNLMYYALFDLTDIEYRWIGSERFPDSLHIRFSEADDYETPDPEISFEMPGNEDIFIDLIIGNLTKLEATANEKGLFTGYVNFLYAYELFDGSIVKHSHIRIIKTGEWQFRNSAGPPPKFHTRVMVKKVWYDIVTDDATLDQIKSTYKNIIKSVNIYMTRPVNPYEITIDDLPGTSSYAELPTKDSYGLENIATNTGIFRLVTKIALDELSESTDNEIVFQDITGIESLEGLPVDNFTHHNLYGHCDFKYNNRIFHGDIETSLYQGYNPLIFIYDPVGRTVADYKTWFEVEIKDIDGIKTVRSEIVTTNINSYDDNWSLYAITAFSYPDARASWLRAFVTKDDVNVYRVLTRPLTPHTLMNVAYFIPDDITRWAAEIGSSPGQGTLQSYAYSALPSLNSQILNPNRVQATEIDNPFYFPARNSYNIGHTKVVGLSANTLLVETGQFGEYPVYVFTQDGVWAMNFSTMADVLIDSIKPASMDVCTSRDSITSTKYGVVFVSDDRLMIISGMKSIKISSEWEGDYISPLANNVDYKLIADAISDVIDSAPFLSYLNGSIISFNESKEELFLTNNDYDYSLVYGIQSKLWYKAGFSYNSLLRYKTKVLGEAGGILYDLTEESYPADGVSCFMESYPVKLDIDGFKRIESYAVRGMFECKNNSSASLYLFGSVDGISWRNMLMVSKNGSYMDIISKRSDYSAVHYIVLVQGDLGENSYLTHFDFMYKDKFRNKMR